MYRNECVFSCRNIMLACIAPCACIALSACALHRDACACMFRTELACLNPSYRTECVCLQRVRVPVSQHLLHTSHHVDVVAARLYARASSHFHLPPSPRPRAHLPSGPRSRTRLVNSGHFVILDTLPPPLSPACSPPPLQPDFTKTLERLKGTVGEVAKNYMDDDF